MSKESPLILVIEDEKLLLDVISKKIEASGMSVIPCSSGEQALDILKDTTDPSKTPDTIWLDYYLKGMSGLEFINEVKKNEDLKYIPIVVISNTATKEKINLMLSLGAAKYMIKAEHRLEHIIDEIKKVIDKGSDE